MSYEMKLAFEDGSSGYLVHYGIKGMKWGVWNAETKARYNENPALREERDLKDRENAAITASLSSLATLAKTGGDPLAAAARFGAVYASSRIAQKAVNAGRPIIDSLVTDPVKREKAQRRFEDRVSSAVTASGTAAATYVNTLGNVPAAAAAFGISYTASRMAKSATRAGKPLIDKLVKDPDSRKVAYKVAELSLRAAANAGLTEIGSAATNMLIYSTDANYKWDQLRQS